MYYNISRVQFNTKYNIYIYIYKFIMYKFSTAKWIYLPANYMHYIMRVFDGLVSIPRAIYHFPRAKPDPITTINSHQYPYRFARNRDSARLFSSHRVVLYRRLYKYTGWFTKHAHCSPPFFLNNQLGNQNLICLNF